MNNEITVIELFSGIGAQERALRQLGIPYRVINTCDCDKDAVLSYAAMRENLDDKIANYAFPNQETMIDELQSKNIGFDFEKNKHTITSRTNLTKLKQYYMADKLTHNLGDISKIEELPYADLVTYSFPCTDLSVAGRGAGLKNICDRCNFNWNMDFENPEKNDICPSCGNPNTKSTRSGLLGEVQRLLSISYKNKTLPKYLLLENVKNLVGKKLKPQFDAWVRWLDSIGYHTYYEVLNAKNYGIPQNRERIFAVSIRKDIDDRNFCFPEQMSLSLRLKDILEKNVADKFYLDDERVAKIINTTFLNKYKQSQNNESVCGIKVKNQATEFDGFYDVAGTLMARDWKGFGNQAMTAIVEKDDISVKQIMNIMPGKNRENPNQGRVYDKNGLSPALTTMEGGHRQPFILEPIIYDDYNSRISSNQEAINTLTTNCGASAERNGVKIIEPIVCEERKDEGIRLFKDGCVGTLRTIDACGDKRVIEPTDIKWKIRKLTTKECWRLMGFSDEDHDNAAKYTSPSLLYKQAGNSICTSCLIAIFNTLFKNDGYQKYLIQFSE